MCCSLRCSHAYLTFLCSYQEYLSAPCRKVNLMLSSRWIFVPYNRKAFKFSNWLKFILTCYIEVQGMHIMVSETRCLILCKIGTPHGSCLLLLLGVSQGCLSLFFNKNVLSLEFLINICFFLCVFFSKPDTFVFDLDSYAFVLLPTALHDCRLYCLYHLRISYRSIVYLV